MLKLFKAGWTLNGFYASLAGNNGLKVITNILFCCAVDSAIHLH